MNKKIKEFIVQNFVEIAIVVNVIGVIWFIINYEDSIDRLIRRFVFLVELWFFIMLFVFFPRRLFHKSRIRRWMYINLLRKYPEVFYINAWFCILLPEIVIFLGENIIGYYVWRGLKYIFVGTRIRGLRPYRRFWKVGLVIMLTLFELYLGFVYMMVIVMTKIDEMIYFFDVKPIKTIIRSRILGYAITMSTFLIWGSSIVILLILILCIIVYSRVFINIIIAYFYYRREALDSEMPMDRIRWIEGSFSVYGFNGAISMIKDRCEYWKSVKYRIYNYRFETILNSYKRKYLKDEDGLSIRGKYFWYERIKRKYKVKRLPFSLLGVNYIDIRTGEIIDYTDDNNTLFYFNHPELKKEKMDFRFLDRHALIRKYSDYEHHLIINNVTIWTEYLSGTVTIEHFKLRIFNIYGNTYYNSPESIERYFYNERRAKYSLAYSFGDLRWMSKKYFEFKDLEPFLTRFYEIIRTDNEERKRFHEAMKEFYCIPGKTHDEIVEYISKNEVFKINLLEYIGIIPFKGEWDEMSKKKFKIMKEFGL